MSSLEKKDSWQYFQVSNWLVGFFLFFFFLFFGGLAVVFLQGVEGARLSGCLYTAFKEELH